MHKWQKVIYKGLKTLYKINYFKPLNLSAIAIKTFVCNIMHNSKKNIIINTLKVTPKNQNAITLIKKTFIKSVPRIIPKNQDIIDNLPHGQIKQDLIINLPGIIFYNIFQTLRQIYKYILDTLGGYCPQTPTRKNTSKNLLHKSHFNKIRHTFLLTSRYATIFILFIFMTASAFSEKIIFSANHLSGTIGDKTDSTTLSGQAYVKTESMEISADEITMSGDDFRFIEANGAIKGTNTESELDFTCVHLHYDRETKIATLSGDVNLTDTKNDVNAKAQLIEYNQNTDIAIMQVDINLTQKDNVCSGVYAVYRKKDQTLDLSGNAQIKQGDDTFRAQEITLDLDSQEITLDGRVKGSVVDERKSEEKETKSTDSATDNKSDNKDNSTKSNVTTDKNNDATQNNDTTTDNNKSDKNNDSNKDTTVDGVKNSDSQNNSDNQKDASTDTKTSNSDNDDKNNNSDTTELSNNATSETTNNDPGDKESTNKSSKSTKKSKKK